MHVNPTKSAGCPGMARTGWCHAASWRPRSCWSFGPSSCQKSPRRRASPVYYCFGGLESIQSQEIPQFALLTEIADLKTESQVRYWLTVMSNFKPFLAVILEECNSIRRAASQPTLQLYYFSLYSFMTVLRRAILQSIGLHACFMLGQVHANYAALKRWFEQFGRATPTGKEIEARV